MKPSVIGLILFAISFSIFGQSGYNLTDYVIVSYLLTPEQEEEFKNDDGKISPFWSKWEGNRTLDWIMLDPYTHGRSFSLMGVEGPEDFNLRVRCAYGEKGLYIYLEAQDDQFVDAGAEVPESLVLDQPGLNPEWMNDAIDMYIDIYSSSEQKDGRYVTTYDQRTASYVQFQYRFGGSAGPSTVVRVNRYNPTWTGTGDPIKYSHLSVPNANALGLLFEVIPIADDPSRKVQEWLIPWSEVGSGIKQKPEQGDSIAFIVGYNDIDMGEKSPDILRWKNLCDAYCNSNNWGDIEFGGLLNEIAAQEPSAIRNPKVWVTSSKLSNLPSSMQLYTITGRKIVQNTGISRNNNGIMVCRKTFNGSAVSTIYSNVK